MIPHPVTLSWHLIVKRGAASVTFNILVCQGRGRTCDLPFLRADTLATQLPGLVFRLYVRKLFCLWKAWWFPYIFYCHQPTYSKIPKYSVTWKVVVIILKFEHSVMSPKDADWSWRAVKHNKKKKKETFFLPASSLGGLSKGGGTIGSSAAFMNNIGISIWK